MKIEGSYNKDNKELRIVANFDDDEQAVEFQERFLGMIKSMAEEGGAIVVDSSKDNNNDEDNSKLAELATSLVKMSNSRYSPQYQNKFL